MRLKFHSLGLVKLGNFNCQEGKRACESAHGDILMFKFRNGAPHPQANFQKTQKWRKKQT